MGEEQKLRELIRRLGWDAVIPILIAMLSDETVTACQQFDVGRAGMFATATTKAKELASALGVPLNS